TTDSAAFQQYERIAKGQGNSGPLSGEDLAVYASGVFLEHELAAAGPNPTRESLKRALDSMRDVDTGGVYPPLTFAPNRHFGPDKQFGVICCQDNWDWKGLGPPQSAF